MTGSFSELKALVDKLDLKRIASLASRVDLGRLVGVLTQLEPEDLAHLASQVRAKHPRHPLPEPHGDLYELGELLAPEEREIKLRVREFMQREIAPIVDEHWLRGTFPLEVIPKFGSLRIAGLTFKGYGFPGRSCVLEGLVAEEIARVDVSFSTFFGVQSGLAMGSIYLCGSEAQKQAYLPRMGRFELSGGFRSHRARTSAPERPAVWRPPAGVRGIPGSEREEEVDRQRHLRRLHGHLGPRRGRRTGQRLPRRSLDPGLQRDEDRRQDGAAHRAKRGDHAQRLPGPGGEATAQRKLVSKTPPTCCA